MRLPLITLLAMVALISACDRDMSDLESYIDTVNQRPPKPLDPIPEVEPYEPAVYLATELRDPFVDNDIFSADSEPQDLGDYDGPKPIPGRLREPLEAFPIDSLRMVGSLHIDGDLYALIRTGEPLIYRAKVGNYMGQNHGRILSVSADGLILRELLPDGAGRWSEQDTTLTISETP